MKNFIVREIKKSEYGKLENFLYEAIFIPENISPPPREIIFQPELQVYIKNFGEGKADFCFVAEIDKKIVGAAWSRIMNDYGHIDDKTPSLALSVLKNFRRQGIATALMINLSKNFLKFLLKFHYQCRKIILLLLNFIKNSDLKFFVKLMKNLL